MRLADVDLWGHLKYGEQIVSRHEIPRRDIYSYTAYGKPWVDHEWMSEVTLYVFYSHFRDAGLFALKIAIGFLIALFVSLTLRIFSQNILSFVLPFCLTFLTLGHFAMFRPQIFTYLFMSFFVFALCAFYFKRQKTFLYALPFVMMAWCNFHGGFISGLGLLFLATFISRRRWKQALLLFMASGLFTLFNPYGIHLHEAVLRAVLNPYTHQRIVEWKPPCLFSMEFPEYTLYLFLSFACFLFYRPWKNSFLAMLYLAGVFLSLTSVRHIPLFALFAAPALAEFLNTVSQRFKPGVQNALTAVALLLAMEFSVILFPRTFTVAVDGKLFPVSCVNALMKNHAQGNMFTPFEWGEYVLYHLSPDVKVSMDGRYDTVYPWSVIEENYRVLNAKSVDGLAVPMEDKTQWILLSKEKALTKALRKRKNWARAYEGSNCVVFRHRADE